MYLHELRRDLIFDILDLGHVTQGTTKSALLGGHASAHFLTKNPSKKWLALDGVCEDYVSHRGPLLHQGQANRSGTWYKSNLISVKEEKAFSPHLKTNTKENKEKQYFKRKKKTL